MAEQQNTIEEPIIAEISITVGITERMVAAMARGALSDASHSLIRVEAVSSPPEVFSDANDEEEDRDSYSEWLASNHALKIHTKDGVHTLTRASFIKGWERFCREEMHSVEDTYYNDDRFNLAPILAYALDLEAL